MAYSEVVFDTVADLLVSQELPKQHGKLRELDDYVIALCLDSGLPEAEVRARLEVRMKLARG